MVFGRLSLCAAILGAAALLSARSPGRPQAFEWQTAAPESQGMSAAALERIRERLAAANTKALLVIRRDRVVYEWYAVDHLVATKHYTASMAKAIVGGVATGLALTDRRIALDDRVADLVPQWTSDPRKSLLNTRSDEASKV